MTHFSEDNHGRNIAFGRYFRSYQKGSGIDRHSFCTVRCPRSIGDIVLDDTPVLSKYSDPRQSIQGVIKPCQQSGHSDESPIDQYI